MFAAVFEALRICVQALFEKAQQRSQLGVFVVSNTFQHDVAKQIETSECLAAMVEVIGAP